MLCRKRWWQHWITPRNLPGRSAVKTWIFAILKNKIIDLIRQQARTTNVSALSAEEECLDQAFESLFKTNAHWIPGARPNNWGNPEEALREQGFWQVFDACLKHLPENTARVFHDERIPRVRDFRGLPGVEPLDKQLQCHPAQGAQWTKALFGIKLVFCWRAAMLSCKEVTHLLSESQDRKAICPRK